VPKLMLLVADSPARWPVFNPEPGRVGFVMDREVGSEVGFCPNTSTPLPIQMHLLHTHHHLSSGASTVVTPVAQVPSGLSLTPPPILRKVHRSSFKCTECIFVSSHCHCSLVLR
jgi:hypothetical protein